MATRLLQSRPSRPLPVKLARTYADIGEAIVWITDQGMDLTARVLGLKELQELRGQKHRRSSAAV